MKRVAPVEILWIALLVLLPVAVNRLALFPFALDRRLLLHAVGLAAAAWAVWPRRARPDTRSPPRVFRPAVAVAAASGAALLALRALAGAFGLCPEYSFLGLPSRDGGLLSQLSCAALLLAAVRHCPRRVQWERTLVAVCLGTAVPVAVGLAQCAGSTFLAGPTGFAEGRVWSTFGNAIFFGSYLVGAIPATVWTLWRVATHPGWPRARRIAGAAALGVWTLLELYLLVRTGSRGPMLGLLAAGGVSVLLVLRSAGARNVSRALSWAMVAGILLVLGGVQLVARTSAADGSLRADAVDRFNTVRIRLMLYRAMTERIFCADGPTAPDTASDASFRDPRPALRPWLGYGAGCLSYPILRGLPARFELAEGKDHVPDSTHSATMDVLGECGLAGLAALLCGIGAVLWMVGRDRRRTLAVYGLATVGALGMMALWGAHTWAIGAMTGCVTGLLLLAGVDPPPEEGDASRGSRCPSPAFRFPFSRGAAAMTASAAIVTGLWVESQFSVYAATSAVMLHLGLWGLVRETRGADAEPEEAPDDSPFGAWCLVAVAGPAAAFAALCAIQPQSGGVEVFRVASSFQTWLDNLIRASARLHGLLLPTGVALLAMAGAGRRNRLRALVPVAAVAGAVALLGSTEWRLAERDMRVSCAEKLAEGGRPDVALHVVPEEVLRCEGTYAAHFATRARVWLTLLARAESTLPVRREAYWNRAAALAEACARRRPYEADAQETVGNVCGGAIRHLPDAASRSDWIRLAERGYRAAIALAPGSNLYRRRLARLLYVLKGDAAGAQKVFADMLAFEPENAVALNMRAGFHMQEADRSSGADRAAHLREAWLDVERALRSPSARFHGLDRDAARAMRDAAAAALRAEGGEVPTLPEPKTSRLALEAPVFEEASELHLGQALLGALVAMAVSFLLVPPVRGLARRLGWLDAPAARKVHREPTPLLGGLAILAGVWTVALAVPAVPFHGAFRAVLGVATALACVGVIDDRWPLPWQAKIVAQFGAAAALYALGVRVRLAWLPAGANVALTLFWLVGVTNAVNFLDNMNGLTSGLTAWSGAAVAAIALVCGEWDVASFALALTGACIGFLRGNNPWRGTIFMGDTGSLFLGLTLASLALLLRFPNNANWVTWLCPVLLLAVPVFDMSHVCLARLRRGCNPFSTPGKDHTSHLFERLGLPRWAAVLAVHGLVVLCAVATWVVSFSRPVVAYAVAGLVLAGAVFLLVYFELRFGAGGTDPYEAGR